MTTPAKSLQPKTSSKSLDEVTRGLIPVRVTQVKHYTEDLFSFTTERPDSFRFRSGEFVMIGLIVNDKPLLRAYSIASPNWAEELEFYSIKVEDGPLTSRLQKIVEGDVLWMRSKPVGTLVLDALKPGKRLFMISTGTGIAPFASLIRDLEVYENFDQVFLTHTCRANAELDFGKKLVADIKTHPLLNQIVDKKLEYYPFTTRELSPAMGRITEWLDDGRLAEFCGGPLNPELDRVMICGSSDMLQQLKEAFEQQQFVQGSNSRPGDFVIEKAFVN